MTYNQCICWQCDIQSLQNCSLLSILQITRPLESARVNFVLNFMSPHVMFVSFEPCEQRDGARACFVERRETWLCVLALQQQSSVARHQQEACINHTRNAKLKNHVFKLLVGRSICFREAQIFFSSLRYSGYLGHVIRF